MCISAFDTLIVPVFLATLVSCIAGAAFLVLMNAIEALVGRLVRAARSLKATCRTARVSRRQVHQTRARGVGSIG